jgi:hypothetical protein
MNTQAKPVKIVLTAAALRHQPGLAVQTHVKAGQIGEARKPLPLPGPGGGGGQFRPDLPSDLSRLQDFSHDLGKGAGTLVPLSKG